MIKRNSTPGSRRLQCSRCRTIKNLNKLLLNQIKINNNLISYQFYKNTEKCRGTTIFKMPYRVVQVKETQEYATMAVEFLSHDRSEHLAK